MLLHAGPGLHDQNLSKRPVSSPPFPCSILTSLSNAAIAPFSPETPISESSAPPSRPASVSFSSVSESSHTDDRLAYEQTLPSSREDDDLETISSPTMRPSRHGRQHSTSRLKPRRTSTRFRLAHPAPGFRSKQRTLIQIRPRLLLQLQTLESKRATPAFDVIPASILAGSLVIPKLTKSCPRLRNAKPCLYQNDVLIVRSEDYSSYPVQPEDKMGDSLENRELLAVISPRPQKGDDCAEIVMSDGSIWLSSTLPNGTFEFSHINEQGHRTTARWVKRQASGDNQLDTGSASPRQLPWTFSVLDPTRRKHPIIGSLSYDTLEVFDTYKILSPIEEDVLSLRSTDDYDDSIHSPSTSSSAQNTLRPTADVTRDEKNLMVITSIWVNMRQHGYPASSEPRLARSLSQLHSNKQAGRRSKSFECRSTAAEMMQSEKGTVHGDSSRETSAVEVPKRTTSFGVALMHKRRTNSVPAGTREGEDKSRHEPEGVCKGKVRRLTQKILHIKS